MDPLILQAAFERAKQVSDKDARRMGLIVTGAVEIALQLNPTSEKGKQFIREFQGVVLDHADERGFFGDPFRDERHNAYILVKRWYPQQYWGPIGTSDKTPGDFDDAWKAKYLR